MWLNSYGIGLVIKRLHVPLSCNDSEQVHNTHVSLSLSSIIWYWPEGVDALLLEE